MTRLPRLLPFLLLACPFLAWSCTRSGQLGDDDDATADDLDAAMPQGATATGQLVMSAQL